MSEAFLEIDRISQARGSQIPHERSDTRSVDDYPGWGHAVDPLNNLLVTDSIIAGSVFNLERLNGILNACVKLGRTGLPDNVSQARAQVAKAAVPNCLIRCLWSVVAVGPTLKHLRFCCPDHGCLCKLQTQEP
jgi:hypothetical protein